jgi:hypothetical protein
VSRRARLAALLAIAAVLALLIVPATALAAGNDVAHNLASLLRKYAGEIYTGVVAIVGLLFLFNRKYTDLVVFFGAAIVVGWLVFAPDQVASMARAIGERVLP